MSGLRNRTVVSGIWERGLREKCPNSPLNDIPNLDEKYVVTNVYATETEISRTNPGLRAQMYTLNGVSTWYGVGLQLLAAIDWRPDCAVPDTVNIDRAVLARSRKEAPFVFGSPMNMPSLSEKTAHDIEVLLETKRVALLDIEARSYIVDGYGLSAACARTLEGWLRGYGLGGTGIPE